jgi:hypothetical protein
MKTDAEVALNAVRPASPGATHSAVGANRCGTLVRLYDAE